MLRAGVTVVSKKTAPLTIKDLLDYNKAAEIQLKSEMPHKVMCFLGERNVLLSGDQVSVTERGDYMSVKDAREAIEWLVTQFGGMVIWKGGC